MYIVLLFYIPEIARINLRLQVLSLSLSLSLSVALSLVEDLLAV